MNITTLQSHRFWAYLQLMRPANILTAWADVLAGLATVNTSINLVFVGFLILSTTGLYGGGVVFNDVFDAQLDASERPERPIPSGRTSRQEAIVLGSLLLSMGIIAAFFISFTTGILAANIVIAALLYDAIGKHHPVLGPLNMGICRGGNLLLGVSIASGQLTGYWYLALIPIVYIAAITTLSKGEVKGGETSTGIIAVFMIALVIAALFALGYLANFQLLPAIPLIIFFAIQVLLPFIKATSVPTPENIRIAVRSGILSLTILDAAIAAGFAGLPYGLLVLSLLLISSKFAQIFAVT